SPPPPLVGVRRCGCCRRCAPRPGRIRGSPPPSRLPRAATSRCCSSVAPPTRCCRPVTWCRSRPGRSGCRVPSTGSDRPAPRRGPPRADGACGNDTLPWGAPFL
ncbi:unnamed protein product, partial [Ectocarpus sp. 13 AM-2016]